MDSVVEDRDALFQDVFTHFDQVEKQPDSCGLDEELLKRAQRSVDFRSSQSLLWHLLNKGEQLLQLLRQDPRPLSRLLEQVVLLIPFDDLKTTVSSEKLKIGLKSPSVPVQLLILAYLGKASDLPSGASFVACSSDLVKTLLTLWLSTESTEVAERALQVIVALLSVDNPSSVTIASAQSGMGEAHGQGLLWRRIFHDAQVYSLLFLWTSLSKSNHDLNNKKGQQQATISQARLFDFIVNLAHIEWTSITSSTMPEIEREYSKNTDASEKPYGGLLRYAASEMIDPEDYLMEVLRQDFFVKLLAVVEDVNNQGVTPRLLEAIQNEAGPQPTNPTEPNGVHL